MLTMCDLESEQHLVLFSNDLLDIINNYKPQPATEIFNEFNGMNENYTFHCIASSVDELRIILSFFSKFKLSINQSIRLKTMDISQEELDDVLYEFRDPHIINRLLIDVSFDKSGDFINSVAFDQMRLIINDVKKSIPEDATNLEIITYVYNWLKKREYKHHEAMPHLSKRYSTALLTEYIVCVGFSKVFNNILFEYGISASEYQHHLLIDGQDQGHDISMVMVQDEKYGIDGIYFFDLTKDSYTSNNTNSYKYSGFMMTYDDVTKDIITSDMFNKMLLWDNKDIQDTIDLFEPEVKKLTIWDDKDDFDENIPLDIRHLIFNLMQIDRDIFSNEKTIDMFCLGNPDSAMYFICNYILLLKNRFGEKVKDSTIIDLLVNTVNTDNAGYYLAAINSYNPSDDYSNKILEKQHEYIKKRLGTIK